EEKNILVYINNEIPVYEIVFSRTMSNDNLLLILAEIAVNTLLIFCSELDLFLENRELFISNFVKYFYCQLTQKILYDVPYPHQQKIISLLFFMSLMFYNTKNLSSMDVGLTDVLNDLTTEHATSQMKRHLGQTN